MSITCTITKAGRFDEYGRPLTVSQSYTGSYDFVKSLVRSGYASVASDTVFDDDDTPLDYKVAVIPSDSDAVGATKTLTEGVKVYANGKRISQLERAPLANLLDILPTNDTALWTTDKTAALTVAVDNTVLFQGRPTIKITIPAGTSGVCKVGCVTADVLMPYLWDRSNICISSMAQGFTGVDMSTTFPPALNCYIGDASFTNFWTTGGFAGANFPEQKPRQGEWWVYKGNASQWGIGAGAPATALGDGTNITAQKARVKLQWTQTSQATNSYIWVGFVGKLPSRKKPTIVLTWDDGYKSWYDFIAPLCKHYELPISMGIDSALVGSGNYMTEAQIKALYADESNLFDFVNHGVADQNYNTLGAAAYYATLETTRQYLQGIGIEGDGPYHHPYVQSVWGKDLVDLMRAGGYLSARASINPASSATAAEHWKDQIITDDTFRYHLNIIAALGSATSLAQANTAVDATVAANGMGMINAHDFGAAADTYKWTYGDCKQFFGRLAALRDAGTIEVKSWSRWYADLTGRQCDRR